MSVYIVRKEGKRGARWHVRHKVGGNGSVKVLGTFHTKAEAEQCRDTAKASLHTNGRLPVTARARAHSATLGQVAEEWIASRATSGKVGPATIRGYRTNLGQMAPLADMPVQTITEADVQAWINDHLIGKLGLSANTIRICLIRCRKFLDVAKVNPNPARSRDIDRPKVATQDLELPSYTDLMKVRDNLAAGDYPETVALFDVLLHGGLRVGMNEQVEALGLTWRQVDTKLNRLASVKGKYDRRRHVDVLPFQPDWLPVKPAGASDTDRVFPFSYDTFLRELIAASSSKGLPHVHPHLLRHWHGSYLVYGLGHHRLGLASIAQRMGHSVAMLLTTYTHVIMPDDAPPFVSEG